MSPPTADSSEHQSSAISVLLQDALGITPLGTCCKHPNCPVMDLDGQRVMSCRICFSEEKSAGVTQKQSFTAIVDQLQKLQLEQHDETGQGDTVEAQATRKTHNTSGASNSILQQSQTTLESIMKRQSQVHNWEMREKNKEISSLQLTVQQLEQRVKEAETKVDEHVQTIKALRRTIQQDLKVIKTMATHKEKELELSGHSRSSGLRNSNHGATTDTKKAPRAPVTVAKKPLLGQDDNEEKDDDVSESELYSPLKTHYSTLTPPSGSPNNKSPIRSYSSPPKSNQAQRPRLGAVAAAMSGGNDLSQLERRWSHRNLLERSPSTLSLDASVTIPEEHSDHDETDEVLLARLQEQVNGIHDDDDEADEDDSSVDSQENSIFAPPRRSEYWTDADMSIATDPSKIFASFRGGLLDIPKSPPPNRHDKRAPKKKLKIQLDNQERGILKIPSMRSVVRTNSGMSDATGFSTQSDVPLNLMSSHTLPSLYDSQSDVSFAAENEYPMVVCGSGAKPKPSIPGPPSVLNVPVGLDEDGDGGGFLIDDHVMTPTYSIETFQAHKHDTEAGKSNLGDKTLVTVTRARCQDRYGDLGVYTGTILASDGLPHGLGTMNYDSGRVFSGEWSNGHWNGDGKLLNPNGDTFVGAFACGSRHGFGTYTWENGDEYVGLFSHDKRQGEKCKFTFNKSKNVYFGSFVDGMFDGYGEYTFENGCYVGLWSQGRYLKGELRYSNNSSYSGEFKNSLAHGFGIEVSAEGKIRRGVWHEGKPVNFG